jgi:DsbC/DsbD-like thiol-disulfide interchange protein
MQDSLKTNIAAAIGSPEQRIEIVGLVTLGVCSSVCLCVFVPVCLFLPSFDSPTTYRLVTPGEDTALSCDLASNSTVGVVSLWAEQNGLRTQECLRVSADVMIRAKAGVGSSDSENGYADEHHADASPLQLTRELVLQACTRGSKLKKTRPMGRYIQIARLRDVAEFVMNLKQSIKDTRERSNQAQVNKFKDHKQTYHTSSTLSLKEGSERGSENLEGGEKMVVVGLGEIELHTETLLRRQVDLEVRNQM